MKNTVSNLILVFVTMVCMSNTGCWGSEHDPCEDGPKCEPKALGVLKLEQNSANVIPLQGNETVTYVNQQGFQAVYKAQGLKTDTDEQFIVGTDYCCPEYYLKQRKSLLLAGQNLNFKITYKLLKNVPQEYYSTTGIDTALVDDVLMISLGGSGFAVPINNAPIKINAYKHVTQHDSLTLGNQVYRQVYEVSGQPDPSVIGPKGIYYTRQQGLIGYYFNNNELWYTL